MNQPENDVAAAAEDAVVAKKIAAQGAKPQAKCWMMMT
jgi:hypothetical protein